MLTRLAVVALLLLSVVFGLKPGVVQAQATPTIVPPGCTVNPPPRVQSVTNSSGMIWGTVTHDVTTHPDDQIAGRVTFILRDQADTTTYWTVIDNEPPWSHTWDTTTVADGLYRLTVRTTCDASQNVSRMFQNIQVINAGTPTPTATLTPSPTLTPTVTLTPSPTLTLTPTPTATPTISAEVTLTEQAYMEYTGAAMTFIAVILSALLAAVLVLVARK